MNCVLDGEAYDVNSGNEVVISVCLCTYKRPEGLAQCLQSLRAQSFSRSFEVIVTDNDFERSGECVVAQFTETFQQAGIILKYLVEPTQNIALARNRSLVPACGKFIAFIDDDECASSSWMNNLFTVMTETKADGVWGLVVTKLPIYFPKWMRESKLFQQENPEDWSAMKGHGLRTSNALIKRELLFLRSGPFDESLGKTGGSDSDLFNWIMVNGENIKFVWAADAEVVEYVEEKRRYVTWHLRRAYRGGWGFSRGLTHRYGVARGFIFSIIRIIPSFIKALGRAATNFRNIRYAGLIILMNIATNLGKFGYFLGIRVEEYQG